MRPITPLVASFIADRSGLSALNLAAGFAFAAILAGVLGAPLAKHLSPNTANRVALESTGSIDTIVTGSVRNEEEAKRYVVRRSVLQPSPSDTCIIQENGTREGAC